MHILLCFILDVHAHDIRKKEYFFTYSTNSGIINVMWRKFVHLVLHNVIYLFIYSFYL